MPPKAETRKATLERSSLVQSPHLESRPGAEIEAPSRVGEAVSEREVLVESIAHACAKDDTVHDFVIDAQIGAGVGTGAVVECTGGRHRPAIGVDLKRGHNREAVGRGPLGVNEPLVRGDTTARMQQCWDR